jgi:hypothetical protein
MFYDNSTRLQLLVLGMFYDTSSGWQSIIKEKTDEKVTKISTRHILQV